MTEARSELIEKVKAAIDDAPWVERGDSFDVMHDVDAEARAAIKAVAEWLKEGRAEWQGDYMAGEAILTQLEAAE